jgi:hypothetical protein
MKSTTLSVFEETEEKNLFLFKKMYNLNNIFFKNHINSYFNFFL